MEIWVCTFVEGFESRHFIRNKEVIKSKWVKYNIIEAKRGESYMEQNAFDKKVWKIKGWAIDWEHCTEFGNL